MRPDISVENTVTTLMTPSSISTDVLLVDERPHRPPPTLWPLLYPPVLQDFLISDEATASLVVGSFRKELPFDDAKRLPRPELYPSAPDVFVEAVIRAAPGIDVDDEITRRLAGVLGLPAIVAELQEQIRALQQEVAALKLGDPEQLLNAEDAAKLLGMTKQAIKARAWRGQLPVVRNGRSVRFRRGDLLALQQLGATRRRAPRRHPSNSR